MYIKDWISHTRYTQIAQLVLNILLKYHYQQMVSIEFPLVDALIAYSEKHLDYCNEMLKSSYLIDYSLERLK